MTVLCLRLCQRVEYKHMAVRTPELYVIFILPYLYPEKLNHKCLGNLFMIMQQEKVRPGLMPAPNDKLLGSLA